MRFEETPLPGAFVLEIERIEDDRGFFARTWCREELAAHGLSSDLAQSSISYNRRARTMRGLHFQAEPFPEAKVVTCVRGRAFDVIVDLRRESACFRKWFSSELVAHDGRSIYVPEGFAHGFMTLEDETTLHYQISETYHPELSRGVLWNDPAFAIRWPSDSGLVLSAKDRQYAPFNPDSDGFSRRDAKSGRGS